MPRRYLHALELRSDRRVSSRDDNDLQRHFDFEDAAIKLLDRPDAEAAGQLQEDRPIALQTLGSHRGFAVLGFAENGMNWNPSNGHMLGQHAPMFQIGGAFFGRGRVMIAR